MIPPHLHRPALSDYLYGFAFAIILTVVSFSIVWVGDIGRTPGLILIFGLAAVQAVVHLRFFLHYTTSRVPTEATIAMLLAMVMGLILMAGGLIIMIDLHHRMMP